MSIQEQEAAEKKYDPLDTTLKFVDRGDDLDPVSSEFSSLRAEMSCGHAVTPESLTLWCRSQLDEGNYQFRCPALVDGFKLCNKLWSYQEVRRLADLDVDEMQYFEETMARLAVAEYCEVQPCPKCKTSVARENMCNLCVQCVICTADQKKPYQFCWQCQKPWKNPGARSDCCGNRGCVNRDLQILQTCKNISLPEVEGVSSCPSVRACPVCGMKVEHNQTYCKNVTCPHCKLEFCFVCLNPKSVCCKTSSPYRICPSGVAPRQTAIPVWKKK
ncbi:E3 ubiquitin-protein ligase RNF19B [Austrofundulus limnaeus]|uniref:E3 ubiquitin-protein ligase RNF19B-like n=1 Tax=Austrofundulus limnaeus TaxID=52670 RepID=A0A2I4C958_AUSLI|nr:PREDICTED: E3 ubiquitin-protein ligase RNF19B-like [Austrofundulus limnaeus]XP_013876505.1 PREDICTED: E3 ubiquitin-protein ligase RNF19B-like [Austrofundulus limnaeus]